MKVEFEVDDSVYEFMSASMLEEYGITLEEFLARYVTQCVAIAAVDPEKAIEIGENVKAVEGFQPLWDRITRRTEDACG